MILSSKSFYVEICELFHFSFCPMLNCMGLQKTSLLLCSGMLRTLSVHHQNVPLGTVCPKKNGPPTGLLSLLALNSLFTFLFWQRPYYSSFLRRAA